MIFVNSVTDPGHPCVITSGIGFGPTPLSWIRWMSSPPTFGLNCAKPFSADSAFPVVRVAPVRDQLAHRRRGSRRSPAGFGISSGEARAREALAQIRRDGIRHPIRKGSICIRKGLSRAYGEHKPTARSGTRRGWCRRGHGARSAASASRSSRAGSRAGGVLDGPDVSHVLVFGSRCPRGPVRVATSSRGRFSSSVPMPPTIPSYACRKMFLSPSCAGRRHQGR